MSGQEGIFSHDMDGLLGDLFLSAPLESGVDMGECEINAGPINSEPVEQNEKKKFDALLKEAEQKIYMDAKYTKLSCLVHLCHLKSLNGWSNKSFSMLLEFLQDMLPTGNLMPKTTRSAGASHHPKNSRSTAASAHPKDSRSIATSPPPKNPTSPTSGTSPHPKNLAASGTVPQPKNPSGTGPQPKNPTLGPSRQCYSYYRK